MKHLCAVRARLIYFAFVALAGLSLVPRAAAQQTWHAWVGAQTPSMGHQALAFLPNEIWIRAGDSIAWNFGSDEIHTVSFLVIGQTFPSFAVGCPGFAVGSASFDGSTCVTTPPSVKGNPSFTVTFPTAGNYRLQCLVHNFMNGTIHVLDASVGLPHDQAFYDREALRQRHALLADDPGRDGDDHDMAGMKHSGDMVSVRILAANNRVAGSSKLAASSGVSVAANAHVTAGVGEITSTTGGVQTSSRVRFMKEKLVVHAGDTVEWDNHDPQEPHTMTFGPPPANIFAPSPNVTVDPDGGLHAVLNSPSDSAHSGFILQPLADQPGLPVNSNPDNAIAANPTIFRITFKGPGKYSYICVLHDNLGMEGEVLVLP